MENREMTEAEMAGYLADRESRIARGEPVVDLMLFEPYVQTDVNGQPWLVYRRTEMVTRGADGTY